jgi:hypothetical protein
MLSHEATDRIVSRPVASCRLTACYCQVPRCREFNFGVGIQSFARVKLMFRIFVYVAKLA